LITSKIISLKAAHPNLIFGLNNENLTIIEEYFSSKIIARGENIFVEGEDAEFEHIEKLFSNLIHSTQAGNQLTRADVKLFLDFLKHNGSLKHNIIPILSTKKTVVRPRSIGQHIFTTSIQNYDLIFAIGPAGSGKTFLAVCMAISALFSNKVDRIILTRPAIEAGENLGYLPGNLQEKLDPYLTPLYDALNDILPREKIQKLLDSQSIEIIPLGYMRGRTLNNAFVILDEAQNTTSLQLKMFLTRLGVNSKAIITGDVTQVDLPDKNKSSLFSISQILHHISGIKFVYLDKKDIVRHMLVKEIVNAYEHHEVG